MSKIKGDTNCGVKIKLANRQIILNEKYACKNLNLMFGLKSDSAISKVRCLCNARRINAQEGLAQLVGARVIGFVRVGPAFSHQEVFQILVGKVGRLI